MSDRFLWTSRAVDYGRALLTTNEREELAGLLLRLGVEHRWSLLRRGYGIDLDRLADVEAAAQAEGWVVRRRSVSAESGGTR